MNPEAIEREVWDAIGEVFPCLDKGDELLARIDDVIGWRTRKQGTGHADLIWPLALRIELLLLRHEPEWTAMAAETGERRLSIQRIALRNAPDELILAIRTQARLYTFEDEPFDKRRHKELLREAATLEGAHGR